MAAARKITELFLFAAVVFFLSTASYRRNLVWTDEFTMWSSVVSRSPAKWRPHSKLGLILYGKGRYEKALDELKTALELKPDALVTVRCGDVTLTEGRMGKVGDRVAVRVAKALRRPRTTFAMFEKADEPTNRMEAQ